MTSTEIDRYPAPTVLEVDQLKYLAATEFVQPGLRGNMPAILACVATGRAIGVDDMTALRSIYIIDGKPSFAAELMVQLVRRRGHSIVGEVTEGRASIKGRRVDNGDEISVTWTMAMAERAGLASKQNWRRYPEAMLWSRAVSQLCRMLFADCFAGATYTTEELQDEPVMVEPVPVVEPDTPIPPPTPPPPKPPSAAAVKRMHALFKEAGIDDRAKRLTYTQGIIERGITTSTEMTAAEVKQVSKALEQAGAVATPSAPADSAGSDAPRAPEPAESHNPPDESYTEMRKTSAATTAQLERLDELVVEAMATRTGAVPDLWAQVAGYRKTMLATLISDLGVDGSKPLLWQPLRDSLTRVEAGDLRDHLTAVRVDLGLPEPDIPF